MALLPQNQSFGTTGALNSTQGMSNPRFNFGNTPKSKALSNFSLPETDSNFSPKPASSLITGGGQSTPSPLGTNQGIINKFVSDNQPKVAPVKTKITAPDGHIVEHTFPDSSKTSSATETPAQTQTSTQKYSAPSDGQISSSPTNTYPGVIGQGVTASQNAANTGSQNYSTANQGLLNATAGNQQYADRAKEIADSAGQTITDIGRLGARGQAGYRTTGTSPVGEGNAAILAQTTAAQQNAVTQGANMELSGNQQGLTANQQTQSGYNSASGNALSSQGQGITGLGTNASMLAPVMQFGQITNPTTGRVIGAGESGNNPALDSAVANAVQMTKNNTSPSDALATLSGYGQAGVNAFNQAMQQASGGTYSPTVQNTQVATNVAQGAQAQQQAFAMDTALKQVDAITPAVTDFMSKSGLNTTSSPLYNKPINEYINSLGNTAAGQQAKLMMNDIQKYTSQILAAGAGGIPTDVSSAMASIDPSTLNAPELTTYLATLKYLGGNQLSVLQGQKASAYGNGGGYAGESTSITNNIPVGAPNNSPGAGLTNPAEQAAAGTALNIGADVMKAATSGSNILSFILGKMF